MSYTTLSHLQHMWSYLEAYSETCWLILDVKQLNKIMKFYYFYTLKAVWDGQGKIKMYYGMSRDKKELSGKRFIVQILPWYLFCHQY